MIRSGFLVLALLAYSKVAVAAGKPLGLDAVQAHTRVFVVEFSSFKPNQFIPVSEIIDRRKALRSLVIANRNAKVMAMLSAETEYSAIYDPGNEIMRNPCGRNEDFETWLDDAITCLSEQASAELPIMSLRDAFRNVNGLAKEHATYLSAYSDATGRHWSPNDPQLYFDIFFVGQRFGKPGEEPAPATSGDQGCLPPLRQQHRQQRIRGTVVYPEQRPSYNWEAFFFHLFETGAGGEFLGVQRLGDEVPADRDNTYSEISFCEFDRRRLARLPEDHAQVAIRLPSTPSPKPLAADPPSLPPTQKPPDPVDSNPPAPDTPVQPVQAPAVPRPRPSAAVDPPDGPLTGDPPPIEPKVPQVSDPEIEIEVATVAAVEQIGGVRIETITPAPAGCSQAAQRERPGADPILTIELKFPIWADLDLHVFTPSYQARVEPTNDREGHYFARAKLAARVIEEQLEAVGARRRRIERFAATCLESGQYRIGVLANIDRSQCQHRYLGFSVEIFGPPGVDTAGKDVVHGRFTDLCDASGAARPQFRELKAVEVH